MRLLTGLLWRRGTALVFVTLCAGVAGLAAAVICEALEAARPGLPYSGESFAR